MVPSPGSFSKQQIHCQTPPTQRHTPLRDSCARAPRHPRERRQVQARGEGQAEATQAARGAAPPALTALAAACGVATVGLPAAAAAAAESVAYDNSQGTELVKTLAGAAYVLLAGGFIARLWGKRSKASLTERLASSRRPSPDDFNTLSTQKVTPGNTARSALQAGVVGALLFLLTTQLDQFLAAQALPDQYTARNAAGALVTVVRGLAYLITFLFCFNCLGLSALTVQLLFWPEDEAAPQPAAGRGREFVVEVDKSELGPPAEKKSQ